LKAENEPRVAQFDRKWQQYLSEVAGPVNNAFEQSVVAAEKLCAQLDYRSPVETAAQLATLASAMKKVNGYEADFLNVIGLRSDLLQRSSAAQAASMPIVGS